MAGTARSGVEINTSKGSAVNKVSKTRYNYGGCYEEGHCKIPLTKLVEL